MPKEPVLQIFSRPPLSLSSLTQFTDSMSNPLVKGCVRSKAFIAGVRCQALGVKRVVCLDLRSIACPTILGTAIELKIYPVRGLLGRWMSCHY